MINERKVRLRAINIDGDAFTIDEIRTDTLAVASVCRKCIEELDEKYYDWLYDLQAVIYALAQEFDSSSNKWNAFISKGKFWKELKQKVPDEHASCDDILYWACRYMYGAASTKGRRYNRAYKCATTLQQYARERLAWTEIPNRLRSDGGTEEAYELAAAKRQGRRLEEPDTENSGDPEHTNDDGKEEGSKGEGDETETGRPSRSPITATARISKRGSTKSSDGDDVEAVKKPILDVEISADELNKILTVLKQGQRPKITLERVRGPMRGKDFDWVRIKAGEIQYR